MLGTLRKINLGFRAVSDDFDILLDADNLSDAKSVLSSYGDSSGYLTEDASITEMSETIASLNDAVTTKDYRENLDAFTTDEDVKKAYEAICDDSNCYIIDGFPRAVIGVSQDNRIIYDFDKIIEILMSRDGMTEFEALEYYSFNIERAFPYYKPSPIIITTV